MRVSLVRGPAVLCRPHQNQEPIAGPVGKLLGRSAAKQNLNCYRRTGVVLEMWNPELEGSMFCCSIYTGLKGLTISHH